MRNLSDLFPYDLSAIKEIDSPFYAELYIRAFVAGCVAMFLWIALGYAVFIWWFAAYFTALTVHVAVVQAMPVKVGALGLVCVILTSVTASLAYGVAILILWSTPTPIFKLIAIAMTGLAMLSIGMARRQDPLMLACDIFAIGVGVLLMPAWLIWGEGRLNDGMALAAVLLIVFGYFVWGIVDMTHTRQRLAIRIAEDAEQEKVLALGRLTGGVAHDFNNMLTVISGNLELMAMTDSEAEREELRLEIEEAAGRAATITSQLLDFTRQAPLRISDVDLVALLQGLMRVMRRLIPEGVELREDLPAELPPIRSDPKKLETVILNICLNARDAMKGMGKLTLAAEIVALAKARILSSGQTLRPGRYVCLVIEDTGPGIPVTVERAIFEPFFTTKAVGKGSGLGLSMAKGFLEQTSGGIEVVSQRSTSNRVIGAQARLWLPIADEKNTEILF